MGEEMEAVGENQGRLVAYMPCIQLRKLNLSTLSWRHVGEPIVEA